MTRRRRTSLTPEDRALWRAATRGTQPLPPELRGTPAEPPADPRAGSSAGSASEPPADPPADSPAEGPGRAANRPEPPRRRTVRPSPVPEPPLTVNRSMPPPDNSDGAGLDGRTYQRLKRGQLEPEARIDLHGMSAERANLALQAFIGNALARGLRLVLVITGKGGARAGDGPAAPFMLPPPGVLRRHSPRWLRAGPHGREIVGMWSAHPRHGGAGAMYVYLRRRR